MFENGLFRIRNERSLSRKQLALISGVNLRSIQDYEQGHKDLSSAKGSTLHRLSLALDCHIEDLLTNDIRIIEVDTSHDYLLWERLTAYSLSFEALKEKIEAVRFTSNEYGVTGSFYLKRKKSFISFLYKGDIVRIPFNVNFTEDQIPWLSGAATLVMENYITGREFEESCGGLEHT